MLGEVKTVKLSLVKGQTYTVVVGGPGTHGTDGATPTLGTPGEQSSFDTTVAAGGASETGYYLDAEGNAIAKVKGELTPGYVSIQWEVQVG